MRIFEGIPEAMRAMLRPHLNHMTEHGVRRELALVTAIANIDHYTQTPPSQAMPPPFSGEGHRVG